uniref:Uncharacterized protein n=1 Tax=Nelumbo nucifera TaxID=4432 RepID=A0A822XQT3_NELNU|nr:TPA_asm: hypothetical protein HUJ06_024160 [Nelumbo nucifera]
MEEGEREREGLFMFLVWLINVLFLFVFEREKGLLAVSLYKVSALIFFFP